MQWDVNVDSPLRSTCDTLSTTPATCRASTDASRPTHSMSAMACGSSASRRDAASSIPLMVVVILIMMGVGDDGVLLEEGTVEARGGVRRFVEEEWMFADG